LRRNFEVFFLEKYRKSAFVQVDKLAIIGLIFVTTTDALVGQWEDFLELLGPA
jgi:hypothetical protein